MFNNKSILITGGTGSFGKKYTKITLEFDDHYVISPTIQFAYKTDFTRNNLDEIGKPVPAGFEYSSGKNNEWLESEQLIKLLDTCYE